jgi:hypothetical protein
MEIKQGQVNHTAGTPFYFILFCFVLFYFILFYFISFYFILFYWSWVEFENFRKFRETRKLEKREKATMGGLVHPFFHRILPAPIYKEILFFLFYFFNYFFTSRICAT